MAGPDLRASVQHLPTTSAKIRALAAQGVAREAAAAPVEDGEVGVAQNHRPRVGEADRHEVRPVVHRADRGGRARQRGGARVRAHLVHAG